MKTKTIVILVGILAMSCGVYYAGHVTQGSVKIGIITPLTGSSAYWGESTMVGARMAQTKLKDEGINITFIPQDGQLDSTTALSAAQKLVNVDGVSAIYSEFNPASIAVSSFLKGKNVFHLYDSAATSPLDAGPYNFKTYLDYQNSCKNVAQYIKDVKGIARVGVLEMNLEHGVLCVKGIQEVYGNNMVVESYDPSATDFRAQLTKLNHAGVGAIFHASFQPETLTSLREMHDLNINTLFVGLAETMTPDVIFEFKPIIEGDVFFGLPDVSQSLKAQIKVTNNGKDVSDYNAAGLAYVHLVQFGETLAMCGLDNSCISNHMSQSKPVSDIGFEGFVNRIAQFDTSITEFKDGVFSAVK